MQKWIIVTLLALLLAGCSEQRAEREAPVVGSTAADSSMPATDAWIGKWIGPEGTFLEISGSRGSYRLIIQNLDGPRTFEGKAKGDHIEFERDEKAESIRSTDGGGTGMKWLATKGNCLVIKPGEGFCRD